MTGQPASSLPLLHGDDGPPAGEEILIALAAQLEEARPWSQRLSLIATGN
jgi:hypothetical protein